MQLVPEASSFLCATYVSLVGKKTAVFSVSYKPGFTRLLFGFPCGSAHRQAGSRCRPRLGKRLDRFTQGLSRLNAFGIV